jgi:hypothetical protein
LKAPGFNPCAHKRDFQLTHSASKRLASTLAPIIAPKLKTWFQTLLFQVGLQLVPLRLGVATYMLVKATTMLTQANPVGLCAS